MEFGFDLENPLFLSCSNETFPLLLFHTEMDHMPSPTYLQSLLCSPHSPLSVRRLHAFSFILHFSHVVAASSSSSSYLAINYMDRFLSAHPISDEGKPWIAKLVAVSCVSLALKMNKIDFSLSDFQDEFDSVRVERMELLILGALKWRMRSINPFSFLGFFLGTFLDFKDQQTKAMATTIIFQAQYDIELLEFKPSVVAASALLCAAHESLLPSLKNSISNSEYINKENLFKCYNMMQHLSPMDGYDSFSRTSSNSWTPPDLLNVECFSSFTSGSKRIRETNMCRLEEIRIPKCLKFEDCTTNK